VSYLVASIVGIADRARDVVRETVCLVASSSDGVTTRRRAPISAGGAQLDESEMHRPRCRYETESFVRVGVLQAGEPVDIESHSSQRLDHVVFVDGCK
jgi:hypothetical protein